MWEIAFLIFCIFFFKWPCVDLGKALLLATMLSLGSLSCRDKAPGQRECDFSIDGINKCIRDIEQASLAAVSQSLATRDDISVEVRQKAQAQTAVLDTLLLKHSTIHCQEGEKCPYWDLSRQSQTKVYHFFKDPRITRE